MIYIITEFEVAYCKFCNKKFKDREQPKLCEFCEPCTLRELQYSIDDSIHQKFHLFQ